MGAQESLQSLPVNSRSSLNVSDALPVEDISDAQPKQRGLNFGSIAKLARRNVLLISGITVAATGIAALASAGGPSYKGNFSILVEPITSQARSTDPSAISRDRATEAPGDAVDYPTLLQVLQSPEILSKIAEEIKPRYPNVSAESLRRDLATKSLLVQRAGTPTADTTGTAANTVGDPTAKVVEVTYKGGDPERVKYILQKLADGYLKFSLEYRKSRISGGVQFIEDQLPGLQQRVNSLEAELQTLKQRYRITDPATESAALSAQLRETQTARLTSQRELAEQQTLYNNLQRQLGLTPSEALAASSLSENPRYQALLTQLKTVEAQIAVKAARFNEDSPVIKGLRDQQKNLTQLLDQEAQENLATYPSGSLTPSILAFQNPTRVELIRQYLTSANANQQLQVRNRATSQAEAFLNQRLQEFPVIARQYADVQQQLDIATRTLNQFLTQRETLRIEAAQKELPWQVISPPTISKDAAGKPIPAPSNAPRTLAIGAVSGLLLGLIAAMLREKRKNVFFDADDIPGAVNLPMLTVIPFKENSSNPLMSPLAGYSDTFSKAFSSLYTNIRFLGSHPVRSLVVGSANMGDGKTTIALNLALAAAGMGQRVLLVDSDFRAPKLHHLLGLSNTTGLSEMLIDRVSPEAAIQKSSVDRNLSVLTAGQKLSDAIRLLASNSMKEVSAHLQSNFDIVIYDSPDLSEFSDMTFLAAQTDGVLMAVGVGTTKRTALSQALIELKRFNLPVLGVVANHTARSAAASFRQSSQLQQSQIGQSPILEDLGVLKPNLPGSTSRPN
jgi:capsular exopolysaccharide synthesis family protein